MDVKMDIWKQRISTFFNRKPYATQAKQARLKQAYAIVRDYGDDADWLQLSQHYNGFVREFAIRVLSTQFCLGSLKALLQGLNDPVPEVRELSLGALESYLSERYAPELLAVLPELIALTRKTRADHVLTLGRIGAVLVEPSVIVQTRHVFERSRGGVARFLFRLLYPGAFRSDLEAFLRSSLVHQDIVVRQLVVEAIVSFDADKPLTLLKLAMDNSSATVRSRALYEYVLRATDASAHIRKGLLDPSPSVRSVALWAAGRYEINSRDVLDQRFTGLLPVSKLEWLGVLGLAKQYDCELPEHFQNYALNHSSSVVRAEALSLLGKHHQLLLRALDDSADKVFNLAILLLKKCSWQQVGESISAKLQTAEQSLPCGRFEALLSLMPKWLQLEFLLNQMEQTGNAAFWVDRACMWVKGHWLVVDAVTSRAHRELLLERVRVYEAAGLLPEGSVKRLF